MNIYQLNAEYQQLLDKDEYTHDDMLKLEELKDSIENKIIAYAQVIRNNEALIGSILREVGRMQDRLDKLNNKNDFLYEMIAESMERDHIEVIDKCPYFTIKPKLNPVSVDIFDETILKPEFFRTKITEDKKPDKDKIKQHILNGHEVQGARLNRKKVIEIR